MASVATGPSLGVVAAETLAEDVVVVCGVDLVVREGLVSWEADLRALAMLAGVGAALREAERDRGRLGEFSREFTEGERE